MRKNKGQVKFGETFGVIIVVYIIILVGMIWYNNVSTKSILEIKEKDMRDRAFERYSYIVNNHLLHVSQQGDIDEEFDIVSLRVFSNYSNSSLGKEIVRKQLTESTVKVEVLDMEFKSQENITLYNLTPKEFSRMENFRTLIPVVDTINKTTNVGILTVTVYN